jgi:phosphatidylethanolamine/phosphatidyl-N-methylethanolamine N-methyltransferase
MAHDLLLFARNFVTSPLQVAAISPSSRYLARAMAAGLGAHTGRVMEFGAGTGQLTKGLIAAGVAVKNLTLIEMDADFARLLTQRFAGAAVHRAGAQEAASFAAPGSIGAVVSGLPLLSMPDPVVEAVLRAALIVLAPGGEIRQFTYGPRPPISPEMMQKMGLVSLRMKKVWANVPPARVYAFRRTGDVAVS